MGVKPSNPFFIKIYDVPQIIDRAIK
jgi:hypothetical protein